MSWEISTFELKFLRVIMLLVFIPSACFFIYNRIFNYEIDWRNFYESKRLLFFEGKITDKYINYNQRALNIIVIDDNNHQELLGMWKNRFEVGDYVLKEKGSLTIKLVKKYAQDTLFFDYTEIELKD